MTGQQPGKAQKRIGFKRKPIWKKFVPGSPLRDFLIFSGEAIMTGSKRKVGERMGGPNRETRRSPAPPVYDWFEILEDTPIVL